MEQSDEIIGCKMVYRCPKRWEQLTETADPEVRFCDMCSEKVFMVHTQEQLVEKAKQGSCVASWRLLLGFGKDDNSILIGEVWPEYFVKKPRKKKDK